MRTIYKYPLTSTGANIVEMPEGWKPLHVGMQSGIPCLWAQVETEFPKRRRIIWVVGTGWEIPRTCDPHCFLGTPTPKRVWSGTSSTVDVMTAQERSVVDVDEYGHTAEYNELWQEARTKGWKIPINNSFSDASWVSYWRSCQRHERDPSSGRPVVPHRSP